MNSALLPRSNPTLCCPPCASQVPVSYLDKSRPKSLTVLGRKLAVWYHAPSATWRCFEDRCPHRLAPLSGKGALDGGSFLRGS